MDEDRRRKLEAGREKLNSFRKKKNAQFSGNDREIKKQKKSDQCDTHDVTNVSTKTEEKKVDAIGENVSQNSEENSLIKNNTDNSRPNSGIGDNFFNETFEQSSASLTQFNLSEADSYFEIELMDKFLTAEDGLVTIKESEIKSKMDGYNKKLQEFHNALQHRNEIISQLSASLKRTIERRDELELEAHKRDETIATEIDTLKQQLHQATELLRSQKGKNSISAHEMFEVKSQLILLVESNREKDKANEELTIQINNQSTKWKNIHSNLDQEIVKLNEELAHVKKQNELYIERGKELVNTKDKLAAELNHRMEEFSRMQELFHEKINEKDAALEILKLELSNTKTNEEILTRQMENAKEAVRVELDEQYGMHISEMKNQMKKEHEIAIKQLTDEVFETRQERDQLQQRIEEFQMEQLNGNAVADKQLMKKQLLPLESELQAIGQCVIGENTSVNFDEMMFEILQLKNENERLKDALNLVSKSESLMNGNKESEMFLESGDHFETETHIWKNKYEEIVKEKIEMEMEVKSLKSLRNFEENVTRDVDKKCAKRVKLLQDELSEAAAFKLKCESLECEKSALNEKYMNQINALEKTKLDLELKVCDLESRHQSMLKSEQKIKNEYLKLEQEKCIFPDSFLSALKLDTTDFSDMNILVEQMSASENNLTVLKFRLLEEEEIKSALSNKVAYLTNCCEKYEQRQNEMKNEIDTLQNLLQTAWEKHESTLKEFEEVKKRNLNEKRMMIDEKESLFFTDSDVEMKSIDQTEVLKNELQVIEENFFQEINFLKKCLDEERMRNDSLIHQLQINGIEISPTESGERLDLDQKLMILMDSNRELLEEREDMLKQVRNQDEVLMHLQRQMSNVDSQGNFMEQLTDLNRQQKALVDKMQQQNENRMRVRDILNERNILEETLRRDKEALKQKMREKEEVESQLIHHKVELERLRFEKRHLEELLLHKDQIEKELKRQRRSLEDDLAELEHQLRDREDFIRKEKQQLEMEMQKKELALRKWQTDFKEKEVQFDCLHSSLQAEEDDRSLRMRIKLQQDSLHKIEEIRSQMSSHHSLAMNRLKKELEDEFSVREGRLVASHIDQICQLRNENEQQLKLQLKVDSLPQGRENGWLVEELTRAQTVSEKKLMEDVDRNEKTCLEDVRQIVGKLSQREIEIVCNEINMEMAKRQQHLQLMWNNEMETIRLQAQSEKLMELSQLKEELNKDHKNHVNEIIQTFQSQIDLLQEKHEEQIAKLIGEEKLTSKSLMNQLKFKIVKEYQQYIQSFTQQWENEYLERLADLRKEIEAKFEEATTFSLSRDEKKQDDDSAKQTNQASFTTVEKMLDQREELINKVTELRKKLEKVQMAETKILKETLQTEFNAVIEIQTEMKTTLEANHSPVMMEFKKIKEDYEKLQEKYEEITKEEIRVTEEPLDPVNSKHERIIYKKTTPLEGTSRVSEQVTYDHVEEQSGGGDTNTVILEDELNKLAKKLELKHVEDMEQLRIYFEKRCEDMEVKYEEEVARLKSNEESGGEEKEFLLRMPTLTHFCDTSHVLEPNVMELEEHYRTELDEKLQQYRLQLEEVRKQLELKHEQEMESLKMEAEERVIRERENVKAELVLKYTQEIEDIMSKQHEEMEVMKNKYAQELAKETTRVRVECTEQLVKEMEGESEKLRRELECDYRKEIENVREGLELEHRKQMEIVEVRFEAEKAEEINNAVKKLQGTLQQERDVLLERSSANNLTELKAKHEMQLEYTKRECNEKCDKMEKELQNMRNKVDEKQDEIQELQNEKIGILESHKVALATCEREHRLTVEALREQCQEEMRELSAKCDDKIRELENCCKEQVEKIEEERERMQQQHELELDRLKVHYEKQLNEEKDKWQEEITVDNVGKFEEIAQQLDSDHQLELEMRQSLIREHEEKIEQLQHNILVKEKEYEVLVRELKENHERDVLELKDEHNRRLAAELKRVRVEMENLSEEKLQAIALDTETLKIELEDVHRREIIELQKKMSKKHLEEMEVEVSKIINDMEEQKKVLKRKLEDEMEKKMKLVKEELDENNRVQMEKVQEEFVTEKENELKALRNHFDEELARATLQLTNTNGFKEPEEEQPGDTLELQPVDVINRRERENEETDNLIALLQQRVDKLEVERDDLEMKFDSTKQILSTVVHTYSRIEMIINRQLSAIANTNVSDYGSPTKESNVEEREPGDEQFTVDTSMLSFLSEDGFELDLSAKISEMTVSESGLDVCNDEIVASIGTNLQLAVTRLLQILTVTVHQCHESKLAQMELINTATAHGEEAATMSAKCADFELQLTAEIDNRERLALEIHKTIELMENYKKEKENLEEEICKQEKAKENVESELQQAQARISEMEERMAEEKNRFNHQRTLISEGLSSHEQVSTVKSDASTDSSHNCGEQGILEENAQLHTKHQDLQLHSDKERHNLTKRIQELELSLEEHLIQSEQQLENQRQKIVDLQQQVEALEKQQRADKKYFESQAGEFEQEREELQRQVICLQNNLRERDRQRGSEDRLSHETSSSILKSSMPLVSRLESLTNQLQATTETHEETLHKKSQVEFELEKLGEQMKDWQEIVKNLESQVDEKNRAEKELVEQVRNLQNLVKETSLREEELASELEIIRSSSTSDEVSVHVQFLEDQLELRSRELDKYRNSQSFIQELRGQLRNLEEKVDKKTRDLEALQLTASSVSSPSSEDLSLRDQLEAIRSMQADDVIRSASPSYFDEIKRLEEKLEALSRAEEVAIKKTRDLEMTLKKQKQIEEELLQDKEALQQQVNSQLLQISALQARIEEWRHNIDNTLAIERVTRLQECADRDRELLEKKDKEIEELHEQLEQIQSELVSRETEVVQFKLNSQTSKIQDKQWNKLSEENSRLKHELKSLQDQFESISMPAFAQTLLDEKNQEIDHLTQQLEEMQSSLDELHCQQAGDAVVVDAEKMVHKMLATEQQMIHKVNEIQELYDILKVAQVTPYKLPFDFRKKDLAALEKQLHEKEEKIKRLELLLNASQEEISALQIKKNEKESDLNEKEAEVKRIVELADQRKREVDSLRGVLKEKETLLEQVETLQGEVTNLTDFQTKLQDDYDTVQTMLEDTQKDLIKLQEQIKLNGVNHQLEKNESKRLLESKDSEIANLKERLDLLAKNSARRHDELGKEIAILREQLLGNHDSIEMTRHHLQESNLAGFNLSMPADSPELFDKTFRVVHSPQINGKQMESRQAKDSSADTTTQIELECRNKEIEKLVREKEELNAKLQSLLLKNEDLTDKYQKVAQSKGVTSRGSTKAAPVSAEVKKLQQMVQEMKKQIEDQKKEFAKNSQELQKARNHQSTLELELAEIPKLKSQLQQSRDKLELRNAEIENLKSDLQRLIPTEHNLQEIQLQLKKSHEEMTLVNETFRQKEELIKKLEIDIERLKQNETKDKDKKDLEQATANLRKYKTEKELLEANNLVQISEIERLRDETEQYQENMETIHSLLNMEKEEVVKLKEQHKQELADIHNHYKMTLESVKSSQTSEQQNVRSENESVTDYSVPDQMQSLIQKVHKEGVQVLSLSELLLLKSFNSRSPEQISERWTLHQAWENEKQQLLSEIVALKDLLTQATEATASLRTTGQATAELSNLLLQAVSTVFQKEKETMVAELRTHLLANNQATPNDIERLEQRINEMSENQKLVVLRMQHLFREPDTFNQQDAIKQLNQERMQHLKDKECFLKQITKLESDLSYRERHLKKQIELSEYHIKQKEMLIEDMKMSLEMEKKRTLDLSSQLSYEKGINADLDTALTISKSELAKVQTASDREKREIKSLTAACESEKFRSQALLQALECEQSNFSQLQEAMEAEKRRCKSSIDRQQQIIQELQKSLDVSKNNQVKAMVALDQERFNHTNTRQQLEQIQNKTNRISLEPTINERQMEFSRNSDLISALERERRRVVELSNGLSQERAISAADLEREQALCHQLNKKLDCALEQNQELKRDLQREKERIAYSETEMLQLRNQHTLDREREMQKDIEWETKRQLERERYREEELKHEQERQRQRDLELEVQKLRQRVHSLERELEHVRQNEIQLQKDLENEQQKISMSFIGNEVPTKSYVDSNFSRPRDTHLVESAKQQFHCFLFQCHQDLDSFIQELGVDNTIVKNIVRILKSFTRNINQIKTDFAPTPDSGDDNRVQHFLEQVLHHNAELVGFVIQLCEDKMELRRTQMTLEEEIVKTRQKLMTAEQTLCRPIGVTGDTLSVERMNWAQERAALQLALHKAEAETLQLKSSIQLSSSLNGSHENLSLRSEQQKLHDKIRRFHLRYLRAESFRKALVYQKKYLLVVLGGFQESEAATLAMLSQIAVPGMGSTSQYLESRMPRHQFALMKFRSAVRVIVAISRMKFLVCRWHPHTNVPFSPTPQSTSNFEIHCPLSVSRPLSVSSPEEHLRIHRLGATPPVRDLRTRSCLSSHSFNERTAPMAKKNLAASMSASSGDSKEKDILMKLKSDRSLHKYLDRIQSLQHNFNVTSASRSPASSIGDPS